MKKSTAIILSTIFVSLTLLICCVGVYLYPRVPSASEAPTEIIVPSPSLEAATLQPTNTPAPSPTLKPTVEPSETPLPSATPEPPTATPTPEPILLSGSGDSVPDLQKWDGPAIANITYKGGGNFAVWNVDANNNHIDLLVNEIGSFTGTVPIDFEEDEVTKRFEVTASGAWTIEVKPAEQMDRFDTPSTLTGIGPDVLFIQGNQPLDKLVVDASKAKSNFAIWGYGNKKDLLVNEIAPYTGTVLIAGSLAVDEKNLILVIQATGPWSIEVATR